MRPDGAVRTAEPSLALCPAALLDRLRHREFGPFVGVPCSYLAGLLDVLAAGNRDDYLPVTNEGEAVAIAAGASLAGRMPVVLLQNSGLGNAVNPLTSLTTVFGLPVLLLVSWRGDPRGPADEPQHERMGGITPRLLDLAGVRHETMPERIEEVEASLDRALDHMTRSAMPFALVVRRGVIAPSSLPGAAPAPDLPSGPAPVECAPVRPPVPGGLLRREVIARVVETCDPDTVLVATTGKTGRELEAIADRPTNLYVVGSMGCASSIALGIARSCPRRSVVVLDGDGAALMRMEALATIGHYAPANLVHLLLDNGCHESTGGQATLASTVDFPAIARACNYVSAASIPAEGLVDALAAALGARGPTLLRVPIEPGSRPGLGRPGLPPPAVARRLRGVLLAGT